MTSQIVDTESVNSFNACASEKNNVTETWQGDASSHPWTTSNAEAATWAISWSDADSRSLTMSSNNERPAGFDSMNLQGGSNLETVGKASSSVGFENVPQECNNYVMYPGHSDPYGYPNTGYSGYPNYYHSYQQQENIAYSQPLGAYQNTGVPYQSFTSFQNTRSYAAHPSYPSIYSNPGDYQISGGFQSSGYSNMANLFTPQYTSYGVGSCGPYSSVTSASSHYPHDYKQWADYYSQTEVSCAPGTENLPTSTKPNLTCPGSGVVAGSLPSGDQHLPHYHPHFRPEAVASQFPSLQAAAVVTDLHDPLRTKGSVRVPNDSGLPHVAHIKQIQVDSQHMHGTYIGEKNNQCLPGFNPEHPSAHQVTQHHSSLVGGFSSSVRNAQISTNPKIAPNAAFGLSKTLKDIGMINSPSKPAYISVATPKENDRLLSNGATVSVNKPATFPPSLRGYVERALARCKEDTQMTACQAVMKEIITKATADGTLHTRDWDTEPLFPVPKSTITVEYDLQPTSAPSQKKYNRSPRKGWKSRWEPASDEKPVTKTSWIGQDTVKSVSWLHSKEVDKEVPNAKTDSNSISLSTGKFGTSEEKNENLTVQVKFKRRCVDAASHGHVSSDSDTEQSLTACFSGVTEETNSLEETKRREHRSKRFASRGKPMEATHKNSKVPGSANLYSRRANVLVISKSFENSGSRAVEDIDWDSLTVKGTSSEIEKRYLRLTSAPDPATVRPEEVLEKSLRMVQDSTKNYLYKCDQLKSIRQDLTVQHIRNEFTVKVYETHGRLALEVCDLPEYGQCLSQLKALYGEGINGCHMEFAAYNLLSVTIHANNNRDLLSSMLRLSRKAKEDDAVKHALAVRTAIASGNYVMFFRLYKTAPNLSTCIMELYVERMRYSALRCISRSYRPTVPVSYIGNALGFTGGVEQRGDEKCEGLEECVDWLKAHGASLVGDDIEGLQLDAKASSASIYMPVAHADGSLAVDFFTRT